MRNAIFMVVAVVFGMTAAVASDNYGWYKAAPIQFDKIKYDPAHFWTDTIEFGSGGPNYGNPQVIGMCDGKPLVFGYDFNYLEHVLSLGDELILINPSILLKDVDSRNNTVTFTYGTRSRTFNLDDYDAPEQIRKFTAPPAGWKCEGMTFSYDQIPNPDDSLLTMPVDLRIKVISPADDSKARVCFEYARENMLDTLDLIYDINYKIENLQSLMKANADVAYGQDPSLRPCLPNRRCILSEGYNTTVFFFPDYIRNDTVTIAKTTNMTYPAGGSMSSSTIFQTLDLANGSGLYYDDLFKEEYDNEVRDKYLEILSQVLANEYGFGSGQDEDGNTVAYSKEELLGIMSDGTLYDGSVLLFDYRYIALCDEGVIFLYDLSDFSGFGEDSIHTFVIPYAELKKYMK